MGRHIDVLVSDGGIIQLYDAQREIRAEHDRLYRALCLSLALNSVLLAAIAVFIAITL